MRVEVWSDVVCPWCYVGERRFARALERFEGGDVEVVFRPYQLDPGAPERAIPLGDYLRQRYGTAVATMQARAGEAAQEEGVAINWDRALAANTRRAHRLLLLALSERGAEVQRALAERLFALHFERGADVGDVDTLVQAAVDAGMDRDRARDYLASDEGEAELDAALEEARRLGIRAVPTFVFDRRWALQGAQPTDVFLEAMNEAETEGEGQEGAA